MHRIYTRPVYALVLTLIFGISTTFASEPLTIVQLCDTQLGMGGYDHDIDTFNLAVKQINTLEPDLVVICGDLVNTNDDKSFKDFKEINAKFTVPCYLASGNHDVGNEPTTESLARYRSIIGEDYYNVDHKGYSFVVVNTQLWKVDIGEESTKHQDWVAGTLKKNKRAGHKNVIVGHYPLFIQKPDEEELYYNIPNPLRGILLDLCTSQGVVAYMAGHTHKNIVNDYEGIPMVASATTSKNFDGAPMGFRVWVLGEEGPLSHAFVSLKGVENIPVDEE